MENLGDILKNSIKRDSDEKAAKEKREIAAKQEKLDDELRHMRSFIADVTNRIASQIRDGKSDPRVKVKNYFQEEWLKAMYIPIDPYKTYAFQIGEFQQLWINMAKEFRQNGINITISPEHDGMGMDSWHVIVAKPV